MIILYNLNIADCNHVGSIYTLQHAQSAAVSGLNLTYELLGIGTAPQHFTIVGNQVRTTSTLRLNCNQDYTLYIRATDSAGKIANSIISEHARSHHQPFICCCNH